MTPAGLDVVRKLEAYKEGRPQPRGSTINTPVATPENLAALAFVRMGGEARPWGIGFQLESSGPLILTVPDGRQTEPIGEMLTQLSGALCGFLGSPLFKGDGADFNPPDVETLRQVWLPNAAHLSMLHVINLRYTFARADEGSARTEALRALGRACGYLFREAGRVDEVGVIDASQALREAFTFPVDDIRGQHLGLLIAYLKQAEERESLEEAVEAVERQPVSPTLDPALERDDLSSLVDAYNSLARDEKVAKAEGVGGEIREILSEEIARRLNLTLEAARILRSDERPVNTGVDELVAQSISTKVWEYLDLEEAIAGGNPTYGPPSAETDRQAKGAARRFIRMAGADEIRTGALLLNDREMVEEAIAAGDGIRGTVVDIQRRVPEGKKRSSKFWIIEVPLSSPFRLKVDAQVRSVDEDPPGGYVESIEIDGQVRRISVCMNMRGTGVAADSEFFRDRTVTMVPKPGSFAVSKLRNLGRDPGPGAWASRDGAIRPASERSYKGDPLDEIAALRKA